MSSANTNRIKLGERLKSAREYLGLSQEEVARLIGIPRSALSAIEAGQRGVDALELKALAGIYKVQIGYLTGETPEQFGVAKDIAHLTRAVSKLSKTDRNELSRFAEYLSARGKIKKRPHE
jgi:transcriptional regulator with XRE-family HTH domain